MTVANVMRAAGTARFHRLGAVAVALGFVALPVSGEVQASPAHGSKWEGIASFYGRPENGGPTASGERFNMHALTAAHRTAPLGSHMRVTNLRNGRSVVVRINDRGPYIRGRIIDVSQGAAGALGFVGQGLAHVKLEMISSL